MMVAPSRCWLVEFAGADAGEERGVASAWDEPGGRGLATVAALARRWDWTRHGDGKIVWCDFWR
jgi:hypothetical protein